MKNRYSRIDPYKIKACIQHGKSPYKERIDWEKNRIWNRCLKIRRLRLKGYSGREIAKQLKVSYTVIKLDFKRLKEVNMLPPSTAQNGRPKIKK